MILAYLCSSVMAMAVVGGSQQYQKAFDPFLSCEVKGRIVKTFSSPLANGTKRLSEFRCGRNGGYWCFQEMRELSGGRLYSRNFISRPGEEGTITILHGVPGADGKLSVRMYSPRVDNRPQEAMNVWPAGARIAFVFFGEMAGAKIIGQLVTDNATMKTLATGELELRDETRYGKATLRLDPRRGYLPTQVRLTQLPQHILRGKAISSISLHGGSVWPAGRIQRIDWLLDKVEFGKDNEQSYIKTWTLHKEFHCSEGTTVTEEQCGNIESIDTRRVLDNEGLLFDCRVPKGQPVSVVNAPHLAYEWGTSWPVPVVTRLQPWDGKTRRRSFALAAVVATICLSLIAIGRAFIVRRRRQRDGT